MTTLRRTVKSCNVGVAAGTRESLEKAKPVAFLRWEDGTTDELSESELRQLIQKYWGQGQEIPEKLQEALRQFELYPTSQREPPTKAGE